MLKENMLPSIPKEYTARMTRSRAVASRAFGVRLPPKVPTKQETKKVIRGRAKRPASDENTQTVSSSYQNKRRAVLKDVTNVLRDTSYRNCTNASKIQTKNKTQGRKVPAAMVTKVTPAPGVSLRYQEDTRKCMVEEETLKSGFDAQRSARPLKCEEFEEIPQSTESDISGCSLADLRLEEQLSRKALQQRPMPFLKDKAEVGENFENGLEVTDIDSNHEVPLMCSLYASDIYINIRVAELIRRPSSNFMETLQLDISQRMRGVLIDWLVEVSEEYKLASDTLHLAVYFIDRFLSQKFIEKQRPTTWDHLHIHCVVLEMEGEVLNCLRFQLSVPCVELDFLAYYLAELTLVDYSFLKFLPSLIAASAVFLAQWTLDQSSYPWNPTLEYYTNYKVQDMKITVLALQDLQLNASSCSLNAIWEKYQNQKYKSVATLSSPNTLDKLF
ncbi:hypothetical protein MKW94_006236 [Papaver nudicaule]|uniref:Uncharacterized protein n=1 Tax=Papaver nudicaule TaxID=74823 RepID=A0AA41V9U7_PAPNU|nr:hypothetical protein [Papaver nudicaule]